MLNECKKLINKLFTFIQHFGDECKILQQKIIAWYLPTRFSSSLETRKNPLIQCKFNNCDCEGIESLIRPLSVPFLFCASGKRAGKIRQNMGELNWPCVVAKSTYLEFCPDTGLSEFMTQLGGMSHFTSLQWDFPNIDIYILGRGLVKVHMLFIWHIWPLLFHINFPWKCIKQIWYGWIFPLFDFLEFYLILWHSMKVCLTIVTAVRLACKTFTFLPIWILKLKRSLKYKENYNLTSL